MSDVILYDYWRSSASYRVRIALNLLGVSYEAQQVNLLAGAHRSAAYLALNPQGILPSLQIDGQVLTQSLAIIEYLHATVPGSTLLPEDPLEQARVRQLAYAVAMEIHPVCNLHVAKHVVELTQSGDAARVEWMRHFIRKGLVPLDALLAQNPSSSFCYGNVPTMADCCLIPQLYNADRWGVDYSDLAHVSRVAALAEDMPAFIAAHPDQIGPPED